LSLRIYGQRVTTSQISDIVLALGDWLNGISIRTASGLRTRLFRAAEDAQTALSEVKALLEFGTVGGERLLAQVSAERILVVDVQPPTSKTRYRWTAEGLRDRLGLPLTPGFLPVGEWVAFDALGAVDAFGPALLEAAEFDVGRGTVRPSFRGEQPVQTLARLTQPAALPDLAARLRPLLDARPATGRVSGAQSFTPPSQADYILSVDGGNCIAIHGMTGVIVASGANHAAIIQAAINLAGVGGVLAFRAGDYNLDAPITPLNRQTWHTPFQAVFRPTGDNRILSAVDLDLFHLFGTFHIEDTSRNTTSAEAIYLDAAKNCQFQDIFVWDYYKGMTFSGVNGRTFECIFQSIRLLIMRHQGLCLLAEVGDNYFHSVFVKGPSTTEWSTGQGLVIGLYPSVGTVFGGIMFGRVEVLDCQVNVDLQGLYECWFDKILSDNAFGPAMYIGDNVQRLFVGTLWTAGSGDGLWIQGSDSNKCRRLFFNTIMSWINAQYGVIFRGKIEGVTIHTLYCLENQVCQVSYQGLENDNIVISNLTCEDSPAQGVDIDAGGAGANCVIRTANLSGAVCSTRVVLGLCWHGEMRSMLACAWTLAPSRRAGWPLSCLDKPASLSRMDWKTNRNGYGQLRITPKRSGRMSRILAQRRSPSLCHRQPQQIDKSLGTLGAGARLEQSCLQTQTLTRKVRPANLSTGSVACRVAQSGQRLNMFRLVTLCISMAQVRCTGGSRRPYSPSRPANHTVCACVLRGWATTTLWRQFAGGMAAHF
jgi:hypothetical protein